MAERTGSRGLSAVEVLLGLGLLSALFLPVYQLFVVGNELGFKSRLAYLAMEAAREEVDDLRVLASLAPDRVADLKHDWRPVQGGLLGRLTALAGPGALPEMNYPDEYRRILTKVEIGPAEEGEIYPVTVDVRWQETGERLEETRDRSGSSRFELLLVPGRRGQKK